MKNKQRGFAMILGMLITLSFLSLLLLQIAKGNTEEQMLAGATPFYERMKHIVQQINAYQMDQVASERSSINELTIFPPTWRQLEPEYLPNCNANDASKGNCIMNDTTPWGTKMLLRSNYTVPNHIPQQTITIPLPPNNELFAFERSGYISALSKLAGARLDEGQNAVLIVISRLDNAIQHEQVVKRSGNNSTLSGDWDIGGNHAITNAKEVLIRNSDGSQMNLSGSVTDIFVAKHGDRVNKQKCPSHMKPDIQVAIKGIFTNSTAKDFNEVSKQKAYVDTFSNHWTIGLDYYAVNKISHNWEFMHDGEVLVSLRCIQK